MSRRVRSLGWAAAAMLSCPSVASAWCRTTTSTQMPASPTTCVTDGVPLAWARRCQIFSVDVSAGGGLTLPQVETAVTASFDAWNAVQCNAMPVFSVTEGGTVTCDQAEYSSTDPNSNTIAFANDFSARMFPTDAIAITIVWHDTRTGQIYDADMIINEAMGPFVDCPALGCPAGTISFDIRNVVTHEAGHFLGLAHSADATATMFYRADPGETIKRTLATDDVSGLCAAYGGGTIPAECDPTPRHGFDPDCTVEPTSSSKDHCGCRAAGTADTRGSGSVFALLALAVTAYRRRSRGS